MSSSAPLEMNLAVAATDGVTVDVQVVVTYPEGYGLYAVKALEQLAAQTGTLYQEMVSRDDLSVMRALTDISGGDHNDD